MSLSVVEKNIYLTICVVVLPCLHKLPLIGLIKSEQPIGKE